MEAVTEADELVESAIEFEDIHLSDMEDTDNKEFDAVPLSIDGDSRIVTNVSSAYCSDMQLCERENNHCAFQSLGTDFSGDTSSEELDVSDDGASYSDSSNLKAIYLDSVVCRGINQQFETSSSFDHSSTVFKERSLSDSEYISDEDVNIFERRSMASADIRTKNLTSGLSVAGVVASVRDFFSGKHDSFTSLNVSNSFSNTIFLKKEKSEDVKSPLMTCVEFLNADYSTDEDTDVEEVSMDLGDVKEFHGPICSSADSIQSNGGASILEDALRCRGKGYFMYQLQNNTRRSSWTTELLSDDEYASAENDADVGRSKTKKLNSLSNVFKDPDEWLTDEEVVDLDDKEWTETDESGGVRQITQIKTETSIKLEGDGSVLDGEGLVSTTTSTTTRVVTSVVSDPGGQSEFQSTFVQQLSDDDIRQSCEITVNEVLNDNSTAKPEESEHDE